MTNKESNIIKDSCYSQEQGSKLATSTQNEPISSNKRIAKNAIMLYIRMFISMIVGLYTSRVVLNTLGVEDYGIYGVVGGIVGMMGFLNASMSGATSRFITFELGKGDIQRLKDTFSSAMIVHIGIAIVVLVLAETIGLWFLNNKLVIPEGRMNAANWVYQMSVLSTIISVTQVPYNACIIAHEKMSVYAYIEIINVSLKLLIVYLLTLGDFDKLILYAILSLFVSIMIMSIYRIYCIRKFSESHFQWLWNSRYIISISTFSLQNLFAHFGFAFRTQGSSFVLNIIYGVSLNTANSISSTVSGILSQFSINISTAFKPQIIKSYAIGDFVNMNRMINDAIRYSILLLSIFIIPIYFEIDYILHFWLGQTVDYASSFCKITLLSTFLSAISAPLYNGLSSTGDIKKYSFIQGSLYILSPIISFTLCKNLSLSPQFVLLVIFLIQFILNLVLIYYIKKTINQFSILSLAKTLSFDIFPILFLSVLVSFIIHSQITLIPLYRLLLSCISSILIILISIYLKYQKHPEIIKLLNLKK